MIREHWKEIVPFVQAMADGKKVEVKSGKHWIPLFGMHQIEYFPKWIKDGELRIAQEPKWRKWTLDEVPIGAQVRNKCDDQSARLLIVGTLQPDRVFLGSQVETTTQYLFELKEHSTDGGKTWHPCGVLESQ